MSSVTALRHKTRHAIATVLTVLLTAIIVLIGAAVVFVIASPSETQNSTQTLTITLTHSATIATPTITTTRFTSSTELTTVTVLATSTMLTTLTSTSTLSSPSTLTTTTTQTIGSTVTSTTGYTSTVTSAVTSTLATGTTTVTETSTVTRTTVTTTATVPEVSEVFVVNCATEPGVSCGNSPYTHTVSVVHGYNVVGTINVGNAPIDVAYDSADNRVFVDSVGNNGPTAPFTNGGNITIIDPTTNAVIGSISGFTTPWSMLYLPANGTRSAELFVSEPAANDVAIVNPSTGSLITRISTTPNPHDLAYNAKNGDVYVTGGECPNSVSVIDPNTYLVKTINVGGGDCPELRAIAYDPMNGDIYVASAQSPAILSVISPSNVLLPYITLPTFHPGSLTYNPVNEEMYAFTTYGVYLVNATQSIVGHASLPTNCVQLSSMFNQVDSMGYVWFADSCNNRIYVIGGASGTAIIENFTSSTFQGPYGMATMPGSSPIVTTVTNTVTSHATTTSTQTETPTQPTTITQTTTQTETTTQPTTITAGIAGITIEGLAIGAGIAVAGIAIALALMFRRGVVH